MISPARVVDAICCERFSYSEASLIFKVRESKLRAIIAAECLRTGLAEQDLWQSLGKPKMQTSRVAERPKGPLMALARLQRYHKLSYKILQKELNKILAAPQKVV